MPWFQKTVALAVALVLSGCSSSSDEPAPPSETEQPPVTDPGDLGNRTGWHVHDYWDGKRNATLLDTDFRIVDPPGDQDCQVRDGSQRCLELRPIQGALVNPGTRWVNITIDWQAKGPGAQITAAWDRGDPGGHTFSPGKTFLSVQTSEEDNDLPHASASSWYLMFWLSSDTGTVDREATGTIHVQIERPDGPLPLQPPHPDHWDNRSSILVHEKTWRRPTPENPWVFEPRSRDGGSLSMAPPHIVPPATARLEVMVTYNTTSRPEADILPSLLLKTAADYDLPRDGDPPTETSRSGTRVIHRWDVATPQPT